MEPRSLPWYGFCHYCGQSLTDARKSGEGPTCIHCGNTTFMNSFAVSVLIAPCVNHPSGREHGVFIQKRGIAPAIGEWALPSGYVMSGETWESAACRETAEEINVHCRHEHNHLETPKLVLLGNSTNRRQIIIVGAVEWVHEVGDFTPSHEVLERDVMFPDDERRLCFPIHREALALYWSNLGVRHNIVL